MAWRQVRVWLGFAALVAGLWVAVLAQPAWGEDAFGNLTSRIPPVTLAAVFALGGLLLLHLRPRWRDWRVLTPALVVCAGCNVVLTCWMDWFPRPGGLSVALLGLLAAALVLALAHPALPRPDGRTVLLRALLLVGVVVLAAVLDRWVLPYHPSRRSIGPLWGYIAALISLWLLATLLAAALWRMLDDGAVPLPMAVVSLVLFLLPWALLLPVANHLRLLLRLGLVTDVSFGPTAALFGLFLGLAMGWAVDAIRRRRARLGAVAQIRATGGEVQGEEAAPHAKGSV